ncbi:MAG: iron-sulfur cluster insertion protein ErpA [Chloroflexi bacterium]|nr:MAG: iron-sulfur cluster insertion protein ErpA [Chloroflexota bacterium]MBL1195774.1 iron-sulfur cluster insertion protein ErpA [Chloroflexota bacterium]NOH13065.1 iron-sulfur cluster insertion protein ErpA [Chloroflexota bacterium]
MALADTETNVEIQTPVETITVTEAAAKAVQEMLDERNLEDHALRVFVAGGGCSGYQYGMALEPNIRETDIKLEQNGVTVVVDEMSINYLQGASIDFVSDVMQSGFKIDNPNATSGCGCGNSFRTDGEDAPHAHGDGGCGCH